MYLIVGLGNPGLRYAMTRHNVGFWVIDELAARYQHRLEEIIFQSFYARGDIQGNRVILAKPLTYMNRSGLAVGDLVRHFSISLENVLVIYDDLDLPIGRLRLRPGGGSGGHRGMASVISRLGTEQIPRLRLGIGRRDEEREDSAREVVEHVLSRFSKNEEEPMHLAVMLAADAVEIFLADGLDEAMNRYNAKK